VKLYFVDGNSRADYGFRFPKGKVFFFQEIKIVSFSRSKNCWATQEPEIKLICRVCRMLIGLPKNKENVRFRKCESSKNETNKEFMYENRKTLQEHMWI
jgi:hypothetical protein